MKNNDEKDMMMKSTNFTSRYNKNKQQFLYISVTFLYYPKI